MVKIELVEMCDRLRERVACEVDNVEQRLLPALHVVIHDQVIPIEYVATRYVRVRGTCIHATT